MPGQNRSARAARRNAPLQTRVALFWKVIFFIVLLGCALGAIGAVAKPGGDLVLTSASTANAGILWWLCRRGQRSFRFSRVIEGRGLLLNSIMAAPLGRYLLAGFARDHSIVSARAMLLADGYVSMLQVCGMALMLAIRAALIPSTPRRTILVTALYGVPSILVTTVLVPTAEGGLAWRALDSGAYPELPATLAMMWGVAIITCAVIWWVIYGLRAEVRFTSSTRRRSSRYAASICSRLRCRLRSAWVEPFPRISRRLSWRASPRSARVARVGRGHARGVARVRRRREVRRRATRHPDGTTDRHDHGAR
jgi:hypothetical protein